jgi:uncharacterized protein YbjT (DUF2867 family)
MSSEKIILVTGATGKQGGAVLRHLDGQGFRLRALTRKPGEGPAQSLRAKGVDVVQGDLDDTRGLHRALEGAWGVFSVQNTWEAGVEKEEEQGKRLASIARERGVRHFVYSSVGSANKKTGIPHFENKFRVEGVIRELKFPSHVILRPVFFMENLPSPWFLHGDALVSTLAPNTKLQMVAVDDIGAWGARAFTDVAAMSMREIDLAGDAVTLPDAASLLSEGLGRKIGYTRIPLDDVRKNSADFAAMLEWFERVGYGADIAALTRELGRPMLTLKEWVRRSLRPA